MSLRPHLDEPSWWYGAGPGAAVGIAATCLAPLAALYGQTAVRRFVRGRPYRAQLPVICVGNLTAGGTGKTPLTLHLCRQLRQDGLRPAVLTRGYGGKAKGPRWVSTDDPADVVGDEALLLARAAPTLIARDRAAGARAIEQAAAGAATAGVILMDDGLQNPQLAKNLTLAVVDGRRGLGNARVMPAGPLRAPLDFQLGLIDAIIVNEPSPGAGDAVADWLRQRFAGPLMRCTTAVAGDAGWLKGARVVAWAGIGAPQRFFSLLSRLGADVVETVTFADHQALTAGDAQRLLRLAEQHRASLVTTAKDMARLTGAAGTLAQLADASQVLAIEPRFAETDAAALDRLVSEATKRQS